MAFTRRRFLLAASASALAWPRWTDAQSAPSAPFAHGVASGDPQPDAVIIWTRVTPLSSAPALIDVRWQITTDTPEPMVVRAGTAPTSAARDYTVKVDVRGLEPGRTYLYQFETGGVFSIAGRTRTLASSPERLRLAVVSCSNYPAGYFNAYSSIASRPALDAVVHLGDYIYEFSNGDFGDGTALGRLPDPLHEAVTIDDYRRRYACYRRDPDLQSLHQQHPVIAVWDDHEFADNAWTGGAANHDPWNDEGDWTPRRLAAMQAYREWMPVREPASGPFRLYRSFRFGRLATLAMLDARSDRQEQVDATDTVRLADPRRTLLGRAQEDWLYATLGAGARAGTQWSLIGQQVMFSPASPPGEPVRNPDAWDGYQAERARIRTFLRTVPHPVVLTGDVHSSWAFDIADDPWRGYDPRTGAGAIGVELTTPAVSSPPYFTAELADTLGLQLHSTLPHLRYLEGQRRGFVELDISAQRLEATWHHSTTVSRRTPASIVGGRLAVEAGTRWWTSA